MRRVVSVAHLVAALRFRHSPRAHTIDLARMHATLRLARRFMSLRDRVRRMDAQVISSGFVSFKLDLLKYAAPKRPIENHLRVVQNCLRGWVGRFRLRQHRAGVRAYPLHRIRYGASAPAAAFTWVNPRHKRRWGRLLAGNYTLARRVPNMPTRPCGPPEPTDWTHRYLTGSYALTRESAHAKNVARTHASASRAYRRHLESRDWLRVRQTAWKFEYETYTTADFYHDYHMGNVVDARTRCVLNQTTRARRRGAHAYQASYLNAIRAYERRMRKRNA